MYICEWLHDVRVILLGEMLRLAVLPSSIRPFQNNEHETLSSTTLTLSFVSISQLQVEISFLPFAAHGSVLWWFYER